MTSASSNRISTPVAGRTPVIRPAVVTFLAMTLFTGVVYPAIVTGVAKLAFGDKAGGSVIERDGHAVGSALIAQPFTDAKYFWPRPSAANYDGAAGAGSNLGPNNPALADAVANRVRALRESGAAGGTIPADLVTANASGLDPHISPAAAASQIARVARARGLAETDVRHAVADCTEGLTFGLLGAPRVNVLRLNLLLDEGATHAQASSAPHDAFGERGRAFMP